MPLPSIATVANLKALFRHRATARQHTPLAPREVEMAQDVWVMYLTSTTIPCKDFADVLQMLIALQVPQQPLLVKIATDFFESKQHFSFQDFLSLLEQCKTIHIRWLHKIQGKSLDDDLLEAFVAVGGEEDSGGEVDLDQMKEVISEFELKVDLDRIVAEMDTDGNANIDFGEFADLLRERKPSAFMGSLDLSPKHKKELAYKQELLAALKSDVGNFEVGPFPGQKQKSNTKPPADSSICRKEKKDDEDLLFDLISGIGDTTSGEIGSSPVKQLQDGEGGISMMESSGIQIAAPVVLSADEFFDQEQDQDVPTEMFWYRNGKDGGVGFLGLDDPLEGLGTGGYTVGGASMMARSRRKSLGGGRRQSTSTHTSEQVHESAGGGGQQLNQSQRMQQSSLGGRATSFLGGNGVGVSQRRDPSNETQQKSKTNTTSLESNNSTKPQYMAASFYKGSGGLRALTLQERILRPSSVLSSVDESGELSQQPLGTGRLTKRKGLKSRAGTPGAGRRPPSPRATKNKSLPALGPKSRRKRNPSSNDPINYYDGVL